MKRFKTYEETYCGVKWFLRYMGREAQGQCKWYIWSNDIDFDKYGDTLWHSKDEATYVAHSTIFAKKYFNIQNKIN